MRLAGSNPISSEQARRARRSFLKDVLSGATTQTPRWDALGRLWGLASPAARPALPAGSPSWLAPVDPREGTTAGYRREPVQDSSQAKRPVRHETGSANGRRDPQGATGTRWLIDRGKPSRRVEPTRSSLKREAVRPSHRRPREVRGSPGLPGDPREPVRVRQSWQIHRVQRRLWNSSGILFIVR